MDHGRLKPPHVRAPRGRFASREAQLARPLVLVLASGSLMVAAAADAAAIVARTESGQATPRAWLLVFAVAAITCLGGIVWIARPAEALQRRSASIVLLVALNLSVPVVALSAGGIGLAVPLAHASIAVLLAHASAATRGRSRG